MSHTRAPTWLTRDFKGMSLYNFHFFNKPIASKDYDDGIWFNEYESIEPRIFHLLFPECILEPGQGPILVRPELHVITHKPSAKDTWMA